MEGWRQTHEDTGWIYLKWDEDALSELDMLRGNRRLYELYMNEGYYYGASDVARVEILRNFGGIYVDADMVCLSHLDPLVGRGPFWVTESPHQKGRPQNAAMGATTDSDILELYAEAMSGVVGAGGDIYPVWQKVGAGLLQRILEMLGVGTENQGVGGQWQFLDSCSFHPKTMDGKRNPRLDDYLAHGGVVYAEHLFHTTNLKKDSRRGR